MKQMGRSGTWGKLSMALHFWVRELTVGESTAVSRLCKSSSGYTGKQSVPPACVDTQACFEIFVNWPLHCVVNMITGMQYDRVMLLYFLFITTRSFILIILLCISAS